MNKDEIKRIMVKSHKKLIRLLLDFKKNMDKENKKSYFEKFRKEIEMHIYIEENNIFNIDFEEKDKSLINELIKEHNLFLRLIELISGSLTKRSDIGISNLKSRLEAHHKVEEIKLYPVMDRKLSQEEKRKLISKILP